MDLISFEWYHRVKVWMPFVQPVNALKSPDFFIFSSVIHMPLISFSFVSMRSRTMMTRALNST